MRVQNELEPGPECHHYRCSSDHKAWATVVASSGFRSAHTRQQREKKHMNPRQIDAVQTTFQVAATNDSHLVATFYTRLMEAHPDDIAPLFGAPGTLSRVQEGMGAALTDVVAHLDDGEHLAGVLVPLGRWHAGFIQQWMFDPVLAVLAGTIADACGDDWNDEAAEAWGATIAAAKGLFMQGFAEADA